MHSPHFSTTIAVVIAGAVTSFFSSFATSAAEVYGPPNLLKTTPTPFNMATDGDKPDGDSEPVSLQTSSGPGKLGLSRRLLPSRVYLPGRLVVGRPAEFVVKGRPGQKVAVAMADKNRGAKPVLGHDLRLGADRKLVTLGVIPDSGVLSLFIDVPIQGDLIGQHLYFETALWERPDFSDLEIATPVKSEIGDDDREHVNGVIVTAEAHHKRGIRFVPDSAVPLHQREKAVPASLDSGRP